MILHRAGHTAKGIPRSKFSKEAEKTGVDTGIITPQAQAPNEEGLVEFLSSGILLNFQADVEDVSEP